MPPARASGGCEHGSFSTPRSAARPRWQRASIATSGWREVARRLSKSQINKGPSYRFFLSSKAAQQPFGCLDVFERELSGFNQVGHHRLGSPTEQGQQIID